jgi:transcriptional regulator NrdR family protein
MVEKASGALTPFSRAQLFASIYDSCKHLPKPSEVADQLTTTIITNILNSKVAITTSADLMNLVVETLECFDIAAAVQYKAFNS